MPLLPWLHADGVQLQRPFKVMLMAPERADDIAGTAKRTALCLQQHNYGIALDDINMGSDLKHSLENAFLTLAAPYGFDSVLGVPWRGHAPLAEKKFVFKAYQNFLEQTRSNALWAGRKLYKA